jgi:hypothetical protein
MTRPINRIVLAAAAFCFGATPARAGLVLQTPAGLHEGDTFRYVFVTPGSIQPFFNPISTFNAFVQNQAGGATYNGSLVHWSVIGSTSAVDAINNIGQTQTPVYLADGTLVTTSTTSSGLWSGSILHPINEDLTGALHSGVAVYTGTLANGHHSTAPLNSFSITTGSTSQANQRWVQVAAFPDLIALRMYGISDPLTVVPEPSTFVMAGTAAVGALALGWYRGRRSRRGC